MWMEQCSGLVKCCNVIHGLNSIPLSSLVSKLWRNYTRRLSVSERETNKRDEREIEQCGNSITILLVGSVWRVCMFFFTLFMLSVHKLQVGSPASEMHNCIGASPLRAFVTGYRGEIVLSRRENTIWKHQQREMAVFLVSIPVDEPRCIKHKRCGIFCAVFFFSLRNCFASVWPTKRKRTALLEETDKPIVTYSLVFCVNVPQCQIKSSL